MPLARSASTVRWGTRNSQYTGSPSLWNRGASAASTGLMPKSIRLLMACDTADEIDQPPGAPITTHGRPSFMITLGEMALARAFPGSYEFGRPGMGSIKDTQLFHVKPVPGTTMPAQVVSVCVMDTQFPCSSITEMWVVKPG